MYRFLAITLTILSVTMVASTGLPDNPSKCEDLGAQYQPKSVESSLQTLFNQQEPKFKDCIEQLKRASADKDIIYDARDSIGDLEIEFKVDQGGSIKARSADPRRLIEKKSPTNSLNQARIHLFLGDCYVNVIENLKVQHNKGNLPSFCWDGSFPIPAVSQHPSVTAPNVLHLPIAH